MASVENNWKIARHKPINSTINIIMSFKKKNNLIVSAQYEYTIISGRRCFVITVLFLNDIIILLYDLVNVALSINIQANAILSHYGSNQAK